MKKACLIFAAVFCMSAAQAQFCNMEKGTVLLYVNEDREANEVRIDTAFISDVVRKGDDWLVNQSCLNPKTRTRDSIYDSDSFMRFIYRKDGVTAHVVIDEKWGPEKARTLRRELAEYGNAPFDGEADLDEQLADVENQKGAIALPLKKNAAQGEDMPGGEYTLKVGFMKVGMKVDKGKYAGFEQVTVPVGSFDCLKVSYRLKQSILYLPRTEYVTRWYAEGVGLVKEEVADKKGRLKRSRVLVGLIPAERPLVSFRAD